MTCLAKGPWAGPELKEGREDPCRCRRFVAPSALVESQDDPRTEVVETQEVVDREVASQVGEVAMELVGALHMPGGLGCP